AGWRLWGPGDVEARPAGRTGSGAALAACWAAAAAARSAASRSSRRFFLPNTRAPSSYDRHDACGFGSRNGGHFVDPSPRQSRGTERPAGCVELLLRACTLESNHASTLPHERSGPTNELVESRDSTRRHDV